MAHVVMERAYVVRSRDEDVRQAAIEHEARGAQRPLPRLDDRDIEPFEELAGLEVLLKLEARDREGQRERFLQREGSEPRGEACLVRGVQVAAAVGGLERGEAPGVRLVTVVASTRRFGHAARQNPIIMVLAKDIHDFRRGRQLVPREGGLGFAFKEEVDRFVSMHEPLNIVPRLCRDVRA